MIKNLLIVAILATVSVALIGCGSSPTDCTSAANSNSNAQTPVTVTLTTEDTKVRLVIEGNILPPTSQTRAEAVRIAEDRKRKADSAAITKANAATAAISSENRLTDEEAMRTFKASDNPTYIRYLEYKANNDFNVIKEIEESSAAYRLYKLKTAQSDSKYALAKASAETQKEQDQFVAEFVLAKEMELINKKYGPGN